MKSRSFLLRLLNVYPDEWWLVKRMYMLQFFQGAGIAFFFTSAFAQFLERFPITELPWVMICSAGFLWLTGILYAKLEHALSFKTFNIGTMVFTTLSMLIFWFSDHQTTGDWFFYLMMSWFYVLYLLDNLGFWGIAALLFDVRQSKRLFAVISAGDIPAKFVGYSIALILVPYTGTRHLILIGAGCMLASLPSFLAILRSGKHQKHHVHLGQPAHHHQKTKKISKVVSNIVTNTYVRRIALISLITSCSVILFNYGLYGEVAKAYHEDVELATFIAFFYATIRIIAFVTKMIFTSRLTLSLGVKSALFITPVGMMVLIAAIIGVSWFSPDHKLIFYMFGVASILVEVLRTSFNTPVLLTLMQPLPIHERLRAHNIVKGIMDPFAFFITGVILLVINALGKKADLIHLCYGFLVLGGLWIIGVVLVNRRYVAILVKTISSRYFSRDEFELSDDDVMMQVKRRMMKGSELEVISILNMLNSKKVDKIAEEMIVQLLQHQSDRIKIEALHAITSWNLASAADSVKALMAEDVPVDVRTEAVKTFCRISDHESKILPYVNHHDRTIRLAAIGGMISSKNTAIQWLAESAFVGLLSSSNKNEKNDGIAILHEIRNEYSHPEHARLIEDADPEISERAIQAIGKAVGPKTLRKVFNQVGRHEKYVIEALYNAGDKSVDLIEEQLTGEFMSFRLREKLVALLGKIGGEHAQKVLLKMLRERKHTEAVVRALHRCRYSTDEQTQKDFESLAKLYLGYGVELLHMQQTLSRQAANYDVLYNSLQYELENIRDTLLSIFGCVYDRDKMTQVKYGLSAIDNDRIANAMEIIELLVRRDIGRVFNTMFENTTVDQRCESLKTLLSEPEFDRASNVLTRILSEKPIDYYNWTKACSLYISKKYDQALDAGLFEKFVASENRLLKETALFADSKIVT